MLSYQNILQNGVPRWHWMTLWEILVTKCWISILLQGKKKVMKVCTSFLSSRSRFYWWFRSNVIIRWLTFSGNWMCHFHRSFFSFLRWCIDVKARPRKCKFQWFFFPFFCHSIHFSCQLDYIMIRLGHYLFVCWLLILFVCFNRFIDTLSTVQSVILACVWPASWLSQEEAFYLFFSKLTLDNKFFACFLMIIY